MQLRELLEQGVQDVILTDEAIYILSEDTPPPVYSDKRVEHVTPAALAAHPELPSILQGESLRHGDLKEKHRLARMLLYTYDLTALDTTDKQRLSHQLYGTGGRSSLLESLGGERVGKGAFLIPAQHAQQIESFLTDHGAHYRSREALIGGDR